MYKAVTIFNLVCAFCLLLPFVLNVTTATMISTMIATISVFFILGIVVKVQLTTREAKFYFSAWFLLLIGVLLNISAAYQFLPLNLVTLYAPKLGVLVEVILLSLGLADKIKRVTLEKEQETRKYLIQTLLQNSLKQMSSLKEVKALAESTLVCLVNVTKFTKGVYIIKEDKSWKVSVKIGEVNLGVKLNNPEDAFRLLGLSGSTESFLYLTIDHSQHSGFLIVFGETTDRLDPLVKEVILRNFPEQFILLLDNMYRYKLLKQSAMYDHLTNLLNRKYFLESSLEILSHAKVTNQWVSLMLIDIDHFKKINDTYGHTVGDQAIVYVANQIHNICKDYGIVGRYGGEEFIVLLNHSDHTIASQIADRLLEVLHTEPFILESGDSFFLTVSIGLCSNENQEYISVSEMILHADYSLYHAKNNGRNQVAVYS